VAEPRRRLIHGRRAAGSVVAGVVLAGLSVGVALGPVPAAGAPPNGPVVVARQTDEGPQLPVDPDADPDGSRRRAQEILERSEYQAPDESGETLFDRIQRWIGDRVPSGAGQGGLDIGSFVVVALVVVGALAGLTWLLVAARRGRAAPSEDTDAEIDITPLRSPAEWTQEAERCEREGDHRGAVRARFRALTATLATRDLVADTPGRTAGELRDDVAERAPTLSAAFEPVADLFERAWFGVVPAGPEQSRAARDLAARALAAAPRRRAVPDPPRDGAEVGR